MNLLEKNAAIKMKQYLLLIASELLDTPQSEVKFENKHFFGRNERTITLKQVADEATSLGQTLFVDGSFLAPKTEPLDENGQGFGVNQFSYATYIAEVEVDTDTGQVKVLRIDTYIDGGKIIRKMGAEMQVEGGVAMAIGHTLTEKFIQKNGIPLTDSLSTYLIPTLYDVPSVISSTFVDPVHSNEEVVSKGIAELVLVPVAPAIINAIFDAVGVHINELPATPEKVLLALNNIEKNGN